MGRKQRQACLSLRFFVLIPVIIVLFPHEALLIAIKNGWSWSSVKPDTIFYNGLIWTGNPDFPWGESMAISRGRILRIGSSGESKAEGGTQTRYVDLNGHFVSPGFIDSHVHFIPGGLEMISLDFRNVFSRTEFVKKIELAAQATPVGKWIIGGGWNQHNWGGDMPQASWIDKVTPKHPVWVVRVDGHMGLANSVTLLKMDFKLNATHPKEGGTIARDKDGVPTGLLVDSAMAFVRKHLPAPSLQDRRDALVRASNHALTKGVTAVVDFGSYYPGSTPQSAWNDFKDVYLWADAQGSIHTRVYAFLPLEMWPQVKAWVKETGFVVSQWLRIGGVKAFADGSLGSKSARFHEPYAGDPANYGLYVSDPDWLLESVISADKADLQVAVHSIGDAANDQVLSVVEALNTKNGLRDRRFRMEHVQHLSPGAVSRVGSSGVIASVQPMHLLDDAPQAAMKLGEERSLQSYLFNSLLGTGSRLALGSDWTVSPLDPLRGIQAAWKRTPDGWKTPWISSECITLEAALKGYTLDAAYAAFMEKDVGSLAPGKFGDFVVLSHNILSGENVVPRVLATYVGGLLQYSETSPQPRSNQSI